MQKHIPKILYKYRQLTERTLSMLKDNQVYFASPHGLNDPFDCLAQENMHDNFREDMAKFFAANKFKISPEKLSPEQIQQTKQEIYQDPEFAEYRNEQLDLLRELDNFGILSLTARNDSILMWSHYADFHKGFCIGFTNNLVVDEVIKEVVYSDIKNNHFLFDVFVKQKLSEELFKQQLMTEYFLTKYIDWKYEEEWRILAPSVGVSTYPDSCLDKIIFGLKMPQEDRDQLRSVVSGKNVSFFEAIKNKMTFKIEIKACN